METPAARFLQAVFDCGERTSPSLSDVRQATERLSDQFACGEYGEAMETCAFLAYGAAYLYSQAAKGAARCGQI